MTELPDAPAARRLRPWLRWLPAAMAAALVLGACGGGSATLVGIEREPGVEVGNVTLPVAGSGEDLAFVAPEDGVMVVYFGFTFCPDICPTTLADLREALDGLGEDAERVEVVMATIDPDRDTDEVVTAYVQSFVPDAIAVRTDDQGLLREATAAFGADYIITTDDDGEPEVGHTTSLYAVDDEGKLVLYWAFGTTAEDIGSDLEVLLDRA